MAEVLGNVQGLGLGFLMGTAVTIGLALMRQLRLVRGLQALGVILIAAVVCALVGSMLGWAIGAAAPDYYRAVFGARDRADFSPIDVGIGLGCSEGLIAGVVLGTAAALFLIRRRSRQISSAIPPAANDPTAG